jgi:YD repeat-containing protein
VPPSLPITRTYEYQSGANFIEGVMAGGKRIESVEPHRGNTAPKTTNSDIESTRTFDPHGLLTDSESNGGTDAASKGAKAKVEYFSESAAPHLRGLPHIVREGEGADELITTYEYPSATQTKSTDARGVITLTDYDAWQRPVHVSVTRPGDALFLEQTWRYDDAGRLIETAERKGEGFVTTRFSYDVVGRRLSTMTDGIATVGSMTTSTIYSLGTHTITTTHPGGAITTTELDQLGRTKRSVTITGSSPIEQQFAYDLAGNQVYATDMLVATVTAFDAHGRAVATRAADGTISTTRYDEWSRPIEDKALTSNATTTIASTSYNFTDAGRATSITTQVDAGVNRTTSFGWDGGGRTTRTATNGRASAAAFDVAGRMKSYASGAGNLAALTEIFEKSEVKAHSGDLPIATETSEKNGPAIAASMDRNTAGDIVRENVGSLEWTRTFDQLGNVISANLPKRPETSWQVDARGAVELETLPGGAKNEFAYHANGAQSAYTDPDHEPTTTQTDFLGRPLIRKYKDDTTELTEWDGARMKSFTDRQGRKQSYTYNGKGQLAEVRDGANTLIDQYTYDDAGRLVSWKTPDSEILWSDFNLEGAPKKTTQRRFRDGALLDEYVQTHTWNEHGEREIFGGVAAITYTAARGGPGDAGPRTCVSRGGRGRDSDCRPP